MSRNKEVGDKGEKDVVLLVPCPNCRKPLMQLPPNYPLYDVQCTGCLFRAQVKTNSTSPKKEIFGATWDIADKVLKAGFIMPPLIANFVWKKDSKNHRKIIFYPFIPRTHLKMRATIIKSTGRKLKMFNYISLDTLPQQVLHEN